MCNYYANLKATANELEFVFASGAYTLQLTDEVGQCGCEEGGGIENILNL